MATPRHAWQRPRPPRHASQRPRHALQRPRPLRHAFSQGPRSLTSKKNSPTCCLISCEAKRVVYHQAYIGRCKACLGRCEACRGGRGRCQACLGVAKQAYTS